MLLLVSFFQFHIAGALDTLPAATTAVALDAHFESTSCSHFDFRGFSEGQFIRTCSSGYNTYIEVDGIPFDPASDCLPRWITLATFHSQLSRNAVVITFRIENAGSVARTVSWATTGDICFDDLNDAPIAALPNRHGFIVYSSRHAMTLITRHHPLVDDVSSYWFGQHSNMELNRFNQTSQDFFFGVDSALAFAWRDVYVGPHSITAKSVVMMFGVPDTNHLTFSIISHFPISIAVADTVTVSCSVASANPSAAIRLVIVVDSVIHPVAESVPIGQFDFVFSPKRLGFAPIFAFFAVDDLGCVSEGQFVTSNLLFPNHSPVETTASSPVAPTLPAASCVRLDPTSFDLPLNSRTTSAAMSPVPSASPRGPAPTIPPAPPIPIAGLCSVGRSLDVKGTDDGAEVRTSLHGWGATIQIDPLNSATVSQCQPLHWGGGILHTNITQLTSNALLVSYRAVATTAQVLDLEIDADIKFDGHDDASAAKVPGGFAVYSSKHVLTFVLIDSPLADSVTTFWFGQQSMREESKFLQVNESSFHGEDSAFAFSWQRFSVPANRVVSKTFIVKFGAPGLNQLVFFATTSSVPSTVSYHSPYVIAGVIGSQIDILCSLYMTVDESTAVIYRVRQHIAANSEFEYAFTPSLFGVHPGLHKFTMVIVDDVGTISNNQTFDCSVVSVPNPSSTPITTPSLLPIPTLPAAPPFPIQALCGETANFDVSGDDGTAHVGVTVHGLSTRMRIDQTVTGSAIHCRPLQHFGVFLYTNITHISPNAVVMNFRLVSSNESDVIVDVATDAEILFDNNPSAPIMNWARGFVIYSNTHALTFVGRAAPLVDDVSTYWFGGRPGDLWAQVGAEYFAGGDGSFAFSWQNISVAPGGSLSRSAIMKFGRPNLNELSVDVASAPSSMFVGQEAAIVVKVASGNSNPVNLLLVVDGETSTFWRVLADAPPNVAVEFKLVPESIGVIAGHHSFALYGIDLVGEASRAATFFATVLEERPSATVGMTARRSRSPAESTRQQAPGTTRTMLRSRTRPSYCPATRRPRSTHPGNAGETKQGGALGAAGTAGVIIAVIVVAVGGVVIVWLVKRRRMRAHRLIVSLSDDESDMMRGYVGF